ncbi:MAG: ThuA domain-containing protein, partial [Planctomycetes bacterium]|nr:ThuA domain-containing protein [Planctomycetota bacterium]
MNPPRGPSAMHRLPSSPRGILRVVFLLPLAITGAAPAAEPAAADEAWAATVERHAPTSPTVPRAEPLKLRAFSLATGYQHTVTPSVDKVLQIIGRTSGVFHADITRDIEDLTADRLRSVDVLVLNNTCSVSPRRNLFLDVLETDARYTQLSAEERSARAAELEKSLLDFVRGGKGLVAIHGAPVLLNNSPAFTDMIGGVFDYHPPCQEVTLRTVDPDHPLVAAFRGKEPLVHTDEPYCFKGPYLKRN